jgi:hemerythrin superfamily protein
MPLYTLPSTQLKTKAAKSSAKSQPAKAISLLKADHKRVRKLFREYDKYSRKADLDGQSTLANEICMELLIHSKIEEEMFYPAARAYLADPIVNEAEVEHASAAALIAQIQTTNPEDEKFDAKVKVLREYIEHHIREEEREIFPRLKKIKGGLIEIGELMKARKRELQRCFMDINGNLSEEYLKMFALRSQTKH